MTSPADDDAPLGSGAPEPGSVRSAEPGPVPSVQAEAPAAPPSDGRAGAHAQPIEVPDVPPRPSVVDRRRYFLSSLEPSGEFEAVIVAVTDAGRRRYFTTRDGSRLTEVDHDWFDRRSSDGGRSLLELDERELGELEAELEFVRPVRGRDPIAEAEPVAATGSGAPIEAETATDSAVVAGAGPQGGGAAEPEALSPADATMEEHTPMTDATDRPMPADPPTGTDELDPVTEEFEAMVLEARRSTFVQAEAAASAPAPAPEIEPEPEHAPAAAAPPAPAAAPASLAAPSPTAPLTGGAAVEQVALAKGIAFIAHRGKLDRSGAPYIDHPGRIAERFDPVTHPVEAAAAWLHDVLEDTSITAEELFEAGIRPEVIEVVRLLTRTPEVAADEYYARIRGHETARRVKLADIDDNTARWRLRRLDYDTQLRLVEKYRVARRALAD